MNNHRNPPKPDYYDTVPEGTCRWCNEQIGPTKTGRDSKARWHKECYEEYEILFHTSVTRRAVWQRDKGKCKSCGIACDRKGLNGWQMDHITPLIEAQGDLTYWRLPNLQTLCKPCHKVKTSQEATERAKLRRETKANTTPTFRK
jgi:5-methylcytosine-specific restriction endonuclease McrA